MLQKILLCNAYRLELTVQVLLYNCCCCQNYHVDRSEDYHNILEMANLLANLI